MKSKVPNKVSTLVLSVAVVVLFLLLGWTVFFNDDDAAKTGTDVKSSTSAQAVKGAQGDIGPMGPQGLQGLQGLIGIQGPVGPQGPTGPAGATGPTGATGLTGETGETGAPGADGVNGVSDWEMVSGLTTGDTESSETSTAYCTGTKKVVGGGYILGAVSTTSLTPISVNAPDAGGAAWVVTKGDVSGLLSLAFNASFNVTAYAICVTAL